ncbi:MAG: 60S acidic ribosomal protein P1 [Geoglossum umbratile]|nr:MAG: 60S acidic ribosomal protein P1 [Geoglossum umbratile]
MSNSELATSYAALILADDGVDITTEVSEQADKLQTLIKAAKIDDVEPIWTSLFAKALEGKDVKDLLLNVGSGGGAAAAPAAGGATGGTAPEEAAKEEEKEEEKEESDEDMGFGLFD